MITKEFITEWLNSLNISNYSIAPYIGLISPGHGQEFFFGQAYTVSATFENVAFSNANTFPSNTVLFANLLTQNHFGFGYMVYITNPVDSQTLLYNLQNYTPFEIVYSE